MESESMSRPQGEATNSCTFQGRRKHATKLVSPRPEALHPLSSTPQRESTPGSKRGLVQSEIHPSFFTALDIPIPANKEPLRTRIWPVLTRMNNGQKETLVHSKNKTPPSLPLSIRLSGPMELEETMWGPNSAWPELMQRIELELVEKSKKHLHWKALDTIPNLNNEIEFAASAHNLLKKVDAGDTTCQALNNEAASIFASPQAARKKRFTKLDVTRVPREAMGPSTQEDKKEAVGGQKLAHSKEANPTGSLSQPAARSRLTYD
ncbi:unnamed protein product [Sphagnum troendelagicum]|uniref:Uncharacterized protein n=1 Tax=Sphagnum troendelagicum TaxID=128251 RepID=A0ABP0TY85_9BRYO